MKISTTGVLIGNPGPKKARSGAVCVSATLRADGWSDAPMQGSVRLYAFGLLADRLACLTGGTRIYVEGYATLTLSGVLHVRCITVESQEQRYQFGCRMLKQLRDSLIVQKPGEGIF